jgi:hypothetical protein
MWNPFRTRLTETDRQRIRRLERTTDDLVNDVALFTERFTKLNARLLGRARKAAAVGESVDGDAGGPGDVLQPDRVDPESVPRVELVDGQDRSRMRESLRDLARQRGIIGRGS